MTGNLEKFTLQDKSKLTDEEVNKLHDETLKECVKITDNFIDSGIRRMQWTLTNGFNVTFTDRKRKR